MTSLPGERGEPPAPSRHHHRPHDHHITHHHIPHHGHAPRLAREAYAGLVSRLLALFVDAVLLAVVVSLVGNGVPTLWDAVLGRAPEWLRVCAAVLAALAPFGYFWLCWCTAGCTLGGALLGTAVRRPDGTRVGTARAALRAAIGILLAPIWLVGLLYSVFDPRRRGLHDVLLSTVVRRA